MDRAYAAVPGTTPWVAIASAKALSRTLPSKAIIPASSQHTSETGSEPRKAVLAKSVLAKSVLLKAGLLKAGPSPPGRAQVGLS